MTANEIAGQMLQYAAEQRAAGRTTVSVELVEYWARELRKPAYTYPYVSPFYYPFGDVYSTVPFPTRVTVRRFGFF